MKNLMSLSIYLMKNLKYKYKFGLILLVFTVVLVALSSVIIANYNAQIGKVEKELQGVKYNKQIVNLLKQITEHKSLLKKNINESDRESKTELIKLNHQLDSTLAAIIKEDKLMNDILHNTRILYTKHEFKKVKNAEGKEVTKKQKVTKEDTMLVVLRYYIDEVKKKVEHRSYSNNTKYHDLINDDIFTSFLEISSASRLNLDDQANTSYFIDIAYDVIPNLLIATSNSAELAYELAVEQYSTQKQNQDLTGYLAELKKYNKILNDNIKRLKKEDSSMQYLIENEHSAVKANLKKLIETIDEKIINSYDIEEESETFYNLLNESRSSIKGLLKVNLDLLEKALNKRLNSYKMQSFVVIGVIIVSILISLYLFLGLFLLVQDTINSIKKSAELMAQGDFTTKVKVQTNDELGDLAVSLNKTIDSLKELVYEIFASSSDLDASSNMILESAKQTATGAQQVAMSIEQLVVGIQDQSRNVQTSLEKINEINTAIQNISDNAGHSVELSRSTQQNANDGFNRSKTAVDKINQIKERSLETAGVINELNALSTNIGEIVDMIKTIANQTNLLALNAAIEAARAGEQGKGFAVVADEVKKLANQSAEASNNITNMIIQVQAKTNNAVNIITQSVNEVEEGVSIIEDTGSMLSNILTAAKASGDQIEGISSEVINLAKSSDQIVNMIDNISGFTEESSASAEEISAITEEQNANTQEINSSINNLIISITNLVKSSSIFKIE